MGGDKVSLIIACASTLAQTLPDIERELPESVRGMIERKIAQLAAVSSL